MAAGPPDLRRRNMSNIPIGSEPLGRRHADLAHDAPSLGCGNFAVEGFDGAVDLGDGAIIHRLSVVTDARHARGALRGQSVPAEF